jgi:hypothetical protein
MECCLLKANIWRPFSFFGVGLVLLCCGVVWGCQMKDFRGISENDLPEAIHVDYSWTGLSPISIRQSFELTLSADQQYYETFGERMEIPFDGQKVTHTQSLATKIPVETVRQMLKAMHEAEWQATDKPGVEIDHTDDYPNLTMTFIQGEKHVFKLNSTSNTENLSPWNLQMDEKLYVNTEKPVGDSIREFYRTVSPQSAAWVDTTVIPSATPTGKPE